MTSTPLPHLSHAVPDTERTSFATEIAAEEESYAALMAQAKESLARITELSVEIDKVRESQSATGNRRVGLLSEIASFGSGAVPSEDCVMEGSDQVRGTYQMEGEYHMEETVEMEVDMVAGEERSFPELMERAKKLLALTTMEGNAQKSDEAEAQDRHEGAYAELWNPM